MIIFPALLGLILCLLNAAGAELFCLTAGCTLYSGYTLFGLSFYVYGAIAFAAIALLAASVGKLPRAAPLLGSIILATLALDLLFLGWQILFWTCASCLVVALLLGWTAVGFWRKYPHLQQRLFKGLLLVWLALLLPLVIMTGKEVLLTPWAIYGPADATIRVFFSPTCPACVTEVDKLLQSTDVGRMAFYPIAKNERDVRLLATLLQEGVAQPTDMARLFRNDLPEVTEPTLSLRWRLARNKMTLARLGLPTIPVIISPTVVAAPRQPWDNLFSPTNGQSSEATGCGVFDQQQIPCE